ncbi:hypothetical protein [Streptomyces sp. NPDC002187]|uniref:hypothetical protein n=1 Tax=Streptomyces sp. NPDC002187 TaxID=3364637 RepID=UPI00368701F2
MPQTSSEQYSGTGKSRKIHVVLPEEPPDVTKSVAAALLGVLIADPSRPCPESGNG